MNFEKANLQQLLQVLRDDFSTKEDREEAEKELAKRRNKIWMASSKTA